jgi:hypothetical protein
MGFRPELTPNHGNVLCQLDTYPEMRLAPSQKSNTEGNVIRPMTKAKLSLCLQAVPTGRIFEILTPTELIPAYGTASFTNL